jgi:hypothetical protein
MTKMIPKKLAKQKAWGPEEISKKLAKQCRGIKHDNQQTFAGSNKTFKNTIECQKACRTFRKYQTRQDFIPPSPPPSPEALMALPAARGTRTVFARAHRARGPDEIRPNHGLFPVGAVASAANLLDFRGSTTGSEQKKKKQSSMFRGPRGQCAGKLGTVR